jgi:hypothetical protein
MCVSTVANSPGFGNIRGCSVVAINARNAGKIRKIFGILKYIIIYEDTEEERL